MMVVKTKSKQDLTRLARADRVAEEEARIIGGRLWWALVGACGHSI